MTTPDKPAKDSGAISLWRSLKTRVTIFTLAFFLISIWLLAFYAGRILRDDMSRVLSEQQFSTVSLLAAQINQDVDDRLQAMEKVAGSITPDILGNAALMQSFLENNKVLKMMFSGGLYVTRADCTAIADVPRSTGRIGMNYSDTAWMIEALKGKSTIGKPMIGRKLHVPVFSIAVPIRDAEGQAIGVLAGVTDLGKSNFLDKITKYGYGQTGAYLLVAPQHKLTVTGTDKSRIMEPFPAPGVNPLFDRYLQGFEGSGIVTDSRGSEVLSSAKQIPVAGWLLIARIPTKEAFAPIYALQYHMLMAAIFLSLLAGSLSWWILRRQLAPVFATIKTLATLSDTDQPLQTLPVRRQDEIGELIGSFNRLLETLRKREDALRESEERYRNLFENANEAIYVAQDGKIVFLNPMLSIIIGRTSNEIIANSFLDFIYPDDRAMVMNRHINRVKGEDVPQRYSFRVISGDDSVKWTEISSVMISWQGKPATLNFLVDITDRKQMDEALQESERKYQSLFNNAEVALFRTGISDGRLLEINERYAQMAGYSDINECMAGFNSAEAWADPRGREELLRIIREKGSVRDYETEIISRDGTRISILFSATIFPEQGYLEGSIVDITDRKRAAEEKQALEERLQRAEKMEALGLLAGGVAHDLNNVIGVIVGYAELIADDIEKSNPAREGLLNIMEGGQRAAAIVQDLLTLARRGVAGRKTLNVNRLILDFDKSPEWEKLHTYSPLVQLQTELEPDLLNISASSVHLQKTLFNLVSNAAEAMPQGGSITIKTANQYLDKPISGYDNIREGDYVVLSVTDEGEGIPQQDLKRIFEPFYTKKVMGRSGTGLGLAVVWGTVKDHQGYIDVLSEEGKGTIFTLYFPVTREDIPAERASISMSEYLGQGESILVVDDVQGQRDLASAMLQKLNYKVASVAGGEEALEYLKKNEVDLLVLDMIMEPGMDGLDTYRKVLSIRPGQKAIIVSGFSESERVYEAQALGAGEYVKKPYVIEKLGMTVKKELNRFA